MSLEEQIRIRSQLPQGQRAVPAGGNAANFADTSSDRKYVLYIVQGDKNSDRAITIASRLSEVIIMNVQSIPAVKRPMWLDRVPSLYSLQDKKCYVGVNCIRFLTDISQQAPLPLDLQLDKDKLAGTSELVGYAPSGKHGQSHTRISSFIPLPRSEADAKFQEQRYQSSKSVRQADIDAYMRRRNEQLSNRSPVASEQTF